MNKMIIRVSAWIAAALFTIGFASSAFAVAPKGGIGAYVWSGDPAAKNAIAAAYSYNSANKANTVKKTGTGTYEVKLEGIGTGGGHAQIGAYGGDATHCKAVRWNAVGSDMMIQVACFNGTAPADSTFTVLFVM